MQYHNIIITLLVTLIQVRSSKVEELNREKSTQPIVRRTFGDFDALANFGSVGDVGGLSKLGGLTSILGSKQHGGHDISGAISGLKNIESSLKTGATDTSHSTSGHDSSNFDISGIMNLVNTGASAISDVVKNSGATKQKQSVDTSTRDEQTFDNHMTDHSNSRLKRETNQGNSGHSSRIGRQENTNSRSSNTGSSESILNDASNVVTQSQPMNQGSSGMRNSGVNGNQGKPINIYNIQNSNQGSSSDSNSSSNNSNSLSQSSSSSCSCTKTCSANIAVKCSFVNGAVNCIKSNPICPAAGGNGSCGQATDPNQCYCDPRVGSAAGSCGTESDPQWGGQNGQNSQNSGSSSQSHSDSENRSKSTHSDNQGNPSYNTGA